MGHERLLDWRHALRPLAVQAPNGSVVQFPGGTDPATVDQVTRQNFIAGGYGRDPEATLPSAAVSTGGSANPYAQFAPSRIPTSETPVALLEKRPRPSLLRKGRGGRLYRRFFALRLVRVKHLSENAGGSNFGQ
jgi:hypothetical protein